ncbi:MAG: hypothetical protein U0R65_12570 [Candidatus Nanopelagicales bacterium]
MILEDDILVDPTFFELRRRDARPLPRRPTGLRGQRHQLRAAERRDRPRGLPLLAHPDRLGLGDLARTWQQYSFDIAGWRRQLPLRRAWPAMGGTWQSLALWSANFDLMARHAIDTWDLQLVRAAMTAGAWSVTPNVNLVENAGFRDDATHTQRRPGYLRAVEPMPRVPDPVPVRLDERADAWLMRSVYGATTRGLAGQTWRAARRLTG